MTMFTLVDFSGAGLKNLGLIKVNTHRVGICNFFQTIKLNIVLTEFKFHVLFIRAYSLFTFRLKFGDGFRTSAYQGSEISQEKRKDKKNIVKEL